MPPSQQTKQSTNSKMAPQNHPVTDNNHEVMTNGEPRNRRDNSNHGHPNQAAHSQGRRSGQSTGTGGIMMNAHSTQQQQRHGGVGGTQSRQLASSAQPTPLFQRLVTEEVQELKAYARIIENQSKRLAELEKIHGDLEVRLEVESRGKAQLEATLEQREREWAMKFRGVETDRDHWKNEFSKEQQKNAKLLDQVLRKDQDIHRMLQRKYDNHRESSSIQSIRGGRVQTTSERQATPPREAQEGGGTPTQQLNKSPHEILAASGSMETVRIRNVKNLLGDFFSG